MRSRIAQIQWDIAEFILKELTNHECHGNVTIIYRHNEVYEVIPAIRYRLSEPKLPFTYEEIINRAVGIGNFARTLIPDTDNLQLNIKLGGKRPPVVSLFYGPFGLSTEKE